MTIRELNEVLSEYYPDERVCVVIRNHTYDLTKPNRTAIGALQCVAFEIDYAPTSAISKRKSATRSKWTNYYHSTAKDAERRAKRKSRRQEKKREEVRRYRETNGTLEE